MPLVNRLLSKLTAAKKLPALPKGVVKPAIVTGVEALGRGQDLNKLTTFLQGVAQMGPQAIARIQWGEAITRFGTSLGIDTAGLVATDDQIAQQQAQQAQQARQQQMMELAGKAAPALVKGASDMIQANGQSEQPPQQ